MERLHAPRTAGTTGWPVVSPTLSPTARLAADPALPRRDDLLDEALVGARLQVRSCTRVRARYRRGESLRATYRVEDDRGTRLVSARMFTATRAATKLPQARDAARDRGTPSGSVLVDDLLDTVFWVFPEDRKLAGLAELVSPPAAVRSLFDEPWERSELLAYTPEKAATVRCESASRSTVGFAKVQLGDEGGRSVAVLRAARRGLPSDGPLHLPDAVGYLPDHHMALYSVAPGLPLHQLPRTGVPAAMTALGAALSRAAPPARRRLRAVHPAEPRPGGRRGRAGRAGPAGRRAPGRQPDGRPALRAAAAGAAGPAPRGPAPQERARPPDRRQPRRPRPGGGGTAAAELGGTLARLWCPRPGDEITPGPRPRPPTRSSPPTHRSLRAACSLVRRRSAPRRARCARGQPGRRPTLDDLEQVLTTAHRWAGTSDEGAPMTRPRLLFYCQHSVGLGHLVRSMHLVDGLARDFDVTLLNGGPWPSDVPQPAEIEIVHLPALGLDAGYALVSRDERFTVEEAVDLRRSMIERVFRETAPEVLLVELFPFGRKKFAYELLPLLEAARSSRPAPFVACSLRDILVGSRRDQQGHDDRAARLTNEFFDAVLVHADARFATLEETFHPQVPLATPVHYTGFVRGPGTATAPPATRAPGAGVGRRGTGRRTPVPRRRGGPPAVPRPRAAHHDRDRAVPPRRGGRGAGAGRRSGPPGWRSCATSPTSPGEMAASAVSVSQAGYNTTMDMLGCATPAVVVPYVRGPRGRAGGAGAAARAARGGARRRPGPAVRGQPRRRRAATRSAGRRCPCRWTLDGRTRTSELLRSLLPPRRVEAARDRLAGPAAGRASTPRTGR